MLKEARILKKLDHPCIVQVTYHTTLCSRSHPSGTSSQTQSQLHSVATKCELVSIGLAPNISPKENVWDLTGADTHRQGVGVGTCQVPYGYEFTIHSDSHAVVGGTALCR